MAILRRLGCVTKLLLVVVSAGILFFAVVALTEPWALHLGEHWTLFTWFGYGKLVTKGGVEYPLFVLFYLDNPSKAGEPWVQAALSRATHGSVLRQVWLNRCSLKGALTARA